MIEYVKYNNQLLAIIVRQNHTQKGLDFFTSENATQQIGCVGHPKGLVVDAHVHNMIKREIFYTSETLIIKKGKVRADIYDNDKNYVESKILESGDVILFTDGGHGFKFLEDCQMVEIKQGPYAKVEDKVRFKGIDDTQVVIK